MGFQTNNDSATDLKSSDKKGLSTELAMGGQALIEGVLMRSPHRVAMAVRAPDGEIRQRSYDYVPIIRRIKWLGLPVIRGGVGLVESLKIGMDALTWSAENAIEPEKNEKPRAKWKDRLAMAFSMVLALVFGLGLFLYLPLWLGQLAARDVNGTSMHQVTINLVAGGVRITLLLGYLWVISLWKDIHRVFQYHGSEHKSIYAFELGSELTPVIALRQSRFHPRCGTSFLLIVALSAVIFFSIVDSLVVAWIGNYPSVPVRFLVHLLLIPVLAGLSYEFLRYSAKHTENRFVKVLIQPGLWLQRITTQEPDQQMCEVAVTALKSALKREASENQPQTEEPPPEGAEVAKTA